MLANCRDDIGFVFFNRRNQNCFGLTDIASSGLDLLIHIPHYKQKEVLWNLVKYEKMETIVWSLNSIEGHKNVMSNALNVKITL